MKNLAAPAQIGWSLLWRATVFGPFFLAFFFLAFATWILRFFLPVIILMLAYAEEWLAAGIHGIIWLLCIAIWKWPRLRNLQESPPPLL